MATVIEPDASRVNAPRAELLRLREKFQNGDRIIGPAWIILSRLFSIVETTRPVQVCDLLSIQDVSATTAQRCLDYLIAMGMVRLGPGPGKRFRTADLVPSTLSELRAIFYMLPKGEGWKPS